MKLLDDWKWDQPRRWPVIKTIDLHTGGEPLRVITQGLPAIKGKTILEKRRYFKDNYDYIRTGIMWEPRGHADMYGAVITEPCSAGSDFGTFFLHNEGYSTMCGHAIIALVTLVLETGLIEKEGDHPHLAIDVPAGRITARAHRIGKAVKGVSFRNVPSFVLTLDQVVDVPGVGEVKYDVSYGGAFYAFCQAEDLNLSLDKDDYSRLIDLGRKIKAAVMKKDAIIHPLEKELSFLYGTIFTGSATDKAHHSRNVCIFADGEVDRSATGSGVSARAALHYKRGELSLNEEITIESILGTTMTVKIGEVTECGPYIAVIPEVGGSAYITGRHEFYFNPDDPLRQGFIFR